MLPDRVSNPGLLTYESKGNRSVGSEEGIFCRKHYKIKFDVDPGYIF